MRYLSILLVFVFFSAGCTTAAKQPALHDFGLPDTASTHVGNPGIKPVILAGAGMHAASPQGTGAVIARDGVYAASPQGAVTVGAPTWLWDNRIRYRLLYVAPTHVRFYGLDMWIASPPELFEKILVSHLKALNYSLNIQLLEFEQQFDASDRARVVLGFSVDVYSGDNKQKIATQEFRLEQATKTPDAAGAVSGFTDLAKQAAGRIQNWLGGLS